MGFKANLGYSQLVRQNLHFLGDCRVITDADLYVLIKERLRSTGGSEAGLNSSRTVGYGRPQA